MSKINVNSDFLLTAFNCLDYVPGVSSFTSLYNLVRKEFTLPKMQKSEVQASHYYTQLDKKSTTRMVFLVIPVIGNLSVGIYDLVKYGKNKLNKQEDVNSYEIKLFDLDSNKPVDKPIDKERKEMLAAIRKNPRARVELSKELQADKAFILGVIKINPFLLRYADSELKMDAEFMLEAFKESPAVLQYVSPELKANKSFMLNALKISENALEELTPELKADNAFMLDVIAIHDKAFKLADPKLKTDRSFVLDAVKRNSNVFRDKDLSFKNDEEVVQAALQKDVRYLQFAGRHLKANRQFMLSAIKQHPKGLRYADEKLRHDENFILDAVKENAEVVQHLDAAVWKTKLVPLRERKNDDMRADRMFMIKLVRQNPLVFKYANVVDGCVKYCQDQAVAITAVKQDGMLLEYAGEALQKIPRVILAAVRQNKEAICFAIQVPLERNEENEKFIEEMQAIYKT